jgi:hypothetical protein
MQWNNAFLGLRVLFFEVVRVSEKVCAVSLSPVLVAGRTLEGAARRQLQSFGRFIDLLLTIFSFERNCSETLCFVKGLSSWKLAGKMSTNVECVELFLRSVSHCDCNHAEVATCKTRLMQNMYTNMRSVVSYYAFILSYHVKTACRKGMCVPLNVSLY